jgi:hypothetical protein
MNKIFTRPDLIKEVIERKSALLDGCPHLRKWYDDEILYFKTHPKYSGELDYVDLFPKIFDDMDTDKDLKTYILDLDAVNSLLNSNFKNIDEVVTCSLSYEVFDGMPVGTFTISSKEDTVSLTTYSDMNKISELFQYLYSFYTMFDVKRYDGFLSSGYAFKKWDNYSQSYSYYKYIDNGTSIDFKSFDTLEKLEISLCFDTCSSPIVL